MAAFVSYDDDGRAGGTWIGERRKVVDDDDDNEWGVGTTTMTSWEQAHIVGVDEDDDDDVGGDQL